MTQFLPGAFTMACLAIALFFALYWRKTRDRLFAAFGIAFLLFACERIVLAFVPADQEGRHWIFVVRLIGFALIILGVVDKNRPQRNARERPPGDDARTPTSSEPPQPPGSPSVPSARHRRSML